LLPKESGNKLMIKAYDNFIKLAIKNRAKSSEDFLALKKEISGKLRLPLPTNADLRETYEKLVKQGKIKRNSKFEEIMLSRRIRTQSGVAVVAVLTKAYPCPGKCLYCPTEKNMPKSYLSNEPAVMRAISSKFDPYLQVWNRLRSLELNGHKTDKIELIVMGGTFSFLPKDYQKWFIYQCFKACNQYPEKIHPVKYSPMRGASWMQFNKASKKNEKAKHRIVGLTLETRPDYIDEDEILNFRKLGCTRVELGVQSIFNDVLKLNKRGHDITVTIQATKLLKDAGFKINYHVMPGLPGSTLKKDYTMFKELFNNPDFRPDMLKIYPTVVVKNSLLYRLWKKPKNNLLHFTPAGVKCYKNKLTDYEPLDDKNFAKFILKVKNDIIPPYVRISRLVRDVPATSIVAGPTLSNLRQLIAHKSKCPCIRCREVGADYNIKDKIVLDRIDYEASGGHEIFLQYVSPGKDKLFALLRLRIPNLEVRLPSSLSVINILKNAAIIREVHTYGKLTEINKKNKKSPQHIGLGKKLMQEAERIAKKEFKLNKIVVISGVGVRDYYRKLGYGLQDTYMVKNLK
jgi:elongator complex protein 3